LPTTTQLQRKSGFWKYFRLVAAHSSNLANNNVLASIRFPPDKGNRTMLSTEQINDLHRLYWSERWPIRKIERHLRMGWHTIRKYLDAPVQGPAQRPRTSKLDPFKTTIAEWLEKDATATGAVIQQRLRPLGYTGGPTILRDYLQRARPQSKPSRAFVRMEPAPGERFEVDWGHFGALDYSGDKRKLYAFALVEAHSRMLYLEFTHSQSFETFVRCHMHAFAALGGIARETAYDNLATAVAEHDGRLVRFLPRFLGFAREYGFYPRACNLAAGWEKGKVERAIGYARQNFWPLREFTDLHDVNRQARQWLSEVANQRQHRETRQRPIDRFQPAALKPLPVIPYDYRDSIEVLVHTDLRVQFDGNRYCVPQRYVGRHLMVKADSSSVAIYDRVHEVVSYARSWRRGQTFGAERFEAELADLRPAARRSRAQQRLFLFLDGLCSKAMVEAYLRDIADTDRALSRQLTELLELIRQYGPEAVAGAIEKASAARAFGADYVANILRQQQSPRRPQPPLILRDPLLNELATDPLSLLEYDAFILHPGKESDDTPRTKAESTESVDHEPPTGDYSD
jgi:transposase